MAEPLEPTPLALGDGPPAQPAVSLLYGQITTDRLALGIAAAPLVLLAVATLVPVTRPIVAVGLAVGFVGLWRLGMPAAWLWAAVLPLGLRLALAELSQLTLAPGLAVCGELLGAPVTRRLLEAVLMLGSIGALAHLLGANRRSLSIRWPSRPVIVLGVAAPFVLAPLAMFLGPALARPFFGPSELAIGITAALIPAALLATANGVLEEVVFRGAILGWGARVLGPTGALVAQAILFGMVHLGPDYVSPLAGFPVALAVGASGLVAGVIVQRTGSLLLPLAVHVALDFPLYYALACRVPG